MKPTKEHFGIDPRTFRGMLYEDVLDIKLEAAKAGYREAAALYFSLPLNSSAKDMSEFANAEMLKHKKSIETIELWMEEIKTKEE